LAKEAKDTDFFMSLKPTGVEDGDMAPLTAKTLMFLLLEMSESESMIPSQMHFKGVSGDSNVVAQVAYVLRSLA
jgi:hypothetical protein